MSKQPRAAATATASVAERSSDLVEDYTARLETVIAGLMSTNTSIISNAEYAARTSALMIALNRQLARCAAAFGEVHGVAPDEMTKLVEAQFGNNFRRCLDAVAGEGQSLQ